MSVDYARLSLITDRTQADLVNDTDKAYIDYADLNRIENAVTSISAWLNSAGYKNTITARAAPWEMTDIRTQSDMDRLRDNIKALRAVFSGYATTPATPASITYDSIAQANAIEQILADLDALEANMEADYRYSAEPISGEEITL
jgi:hypothetical protein